MLRSFGLLDRILRGEATRPAELRDGRLTFPLFGLSIVGVLLAMVYGACMGAYSVFRTLDGLAWPQDYSQLIASTAKTPLLFLLTLIVTFPSLYVFNALVGSRLTFASVLRLLIAAVSVNLAVLASLGPIVAFFSLSTNSYGFMVLLNVLVFALSGALGLVFLLQTLNRLQRSQQSPTPIVRAAPSPASAAEADAPLELLPETPGALDRVEPAGLYRQVRVVFGIWIVVFGLVGAQMGWILRPFIGHPNMEFQWLRPRESNFFEAFATTFKNVMLGTGKTDRKPTDAQPQTPPRVDFR